MVDQLPHAHFLQVVLELLRVAISVDRQTPKLLEVPGSSGTENENGPVRTAAVQDSYRAVACALGEFGGGRARSPRFGRWMPGVAFNRVSLL